MFVLPAIAGVAIGILSGLLGIGGGTVMVPIFRLAFGMSPVVSTATSLFAIKRASCRLALRQASAERSPRLWACGLRRFRPPG